MASMIPFSTPGMYPLEIAPPKMALVNLNFSPRGIGLTSSDTRAYWPWPPVCFLWAYSASAFPWIVSR